MKGERRREKLIDFHDMKLIDFTMHNVRYHLCPDFSDCLIAPIVEAGQDTLLIKVVLDGRIAGWC